MPRLMSGVVLGAPSSSISCDPERPPPTLKSDLKKLRPTSLPPPLPKLEPKVTPGVRPTSANGSRILSGRETMLRVVTTWPGVGGFERRRFGRHHHGLGYRARFQRDFQIVILVHLNSDRA